MQFISSRDSCDKKFQKPVFEIATKEGNLWPVVMVEKVRGDFYKCPGGGGGGGGGRHLGMIS